MILTQAVKLHNKFVHFKYSLRVNKKNILGEYFRSLCQMNKLNQINDLYRNNFVSKQRVTAQAWVGDLPFYVGQVFSI